MTQVAAIARMGRVAAALAAGRVPEPDDARHHAEALRYYLDLQAASLDEAFGLDRMRGEQDPRQLVARSLRDQHLQEAALKHSLDAKTLSESLAKYAQGGWTSDRHADECPDQLRGTVREYLWRALKAWPRVVGEKQLSNIIAEIRTRSDF